MRRNIRPGGRGSDYSPDFDSPEQPEAHLAVIARERDHETVASLWARRFDEAINATERAIAYNPNFALGHITLGTTLHYVGRSEESLKCFERALAGDPYCPDIWLHLQAQANYQLGRYAESADLLKRRILRFPETAASRVLLAAAYGQMGLVEEARVAWRGALAVNPAYSLEQRRQVLPYKDPADFDRIIEGLRKAGIEQ